MDGEYTVKSGYAFIQEKLYPNASSSSNINGEGTFWKKFWSLKAHPRCKELAWRACHEILPVKASLFKRGLVDDVICPLCGLEEEIVIHALVTCDKVAPVWFASPLAVFARRQRHTSLRGWLQDFVFSSHKEGVMMVLNLLHALWYRRNEWAFKQRHMDIDQILCKAAAMNFSDPVLVPNSSTHFVSESPNAGALVNIWLDVVPTFLEQLFYVVFNVSYAHLSTEA
ncbi:hypothetical protein RIF29_40704 [Crotalaria pallida]|uniref:Reverse transcriptase zinc-binding domain-containing protein n=1 Tax=Crotalaria pallida TaxID=3830 RepID=A0AAN9HRX6_CROPI